MCCPRLSENYSFSFCNDIQSEATCTTRRVQTSWPTDWRHVRENENFFPTKLSWVCYSGCLSRLSCCCVLCVVTQAHAARIEYCAGSLTEHVLNLNMYLPPILPLSIIWSLFNAWHRTMIFFGCKYPANLFNWTLETRSRLRLGRVFPLKEFPATWSRDCTRSLSRRRAVVKRMKSDDFYTHVREVCDET